MKLKCIIGSISCNGVLAEVGDVFDMDEEAGGRLVKDGYATLIEVVKEVEIIITTPIEEDVTDKPTRINKKYGQRGSKS